MTITKIISAIGNNKSTYPLLVRDCGIEIPTKVYMTYNQNKEDKDVAMLATRERLVDEYATSAVWLGAIPVIDKVYNFIMKKRGFNPDISSKLLKENSEQGLEYNIKKFKKLAPDTVKDLEFLKNNKDKFKALTGGRVFAQTVIPAVLMGFVIPKIIFAWTAKTKEKMEMLKGTDFKKTSKTKSNKNQSFSKNLQTTEYISMEEFLSKINNKDEEKKDKISFKSNLITKMADYTTKQKMAVTDGGYSIGRVLTARNGYAALDIGFKMLGMLYLNFLFPDQLEKILNKTMSKLSKTNLNLDIKMLDDKEFLNAIKSKKLKLPKAKTGKELLDYVDKNPDSTFVKFAKKYNKLTFLENGVRDPRKFVELDKLIEFKNNMEQTAKQALSTQDVSKYLKKAKFVKGANILANIGISSFLLAWGLPKAQFFVRELITDCKLEPGILD